MSTHLVVLTQLVDLLGHIPQLVIRVARPGELDRHELGAALFGTHEVLLRPGLDPRTARTTLAHELVHLARGPALVGDEGVEESVVEAITAQLLVPYASMPPVISTGDACEVAEQLLIDVPAARLGIELARQRFPSIIRTEVA